MEEKHKCKLCWKSFVNGRALGGHVRYHMLNHPQVDPESASSSMADPGFALLDRESETESSRKPTRKRSRLNRRSINMVSFRHQQPGEEEESETAEEIKTMVKTSQELSESCTEQEPMSSVSDGATEEEDVAYSLVMLSRDEWENDERCVKKKKEKWFECETCEKVFKSYQALGGHRASHKKKRALEEMSSSYSALIVLSDEKMKKKKKKKKTLTHQKFEF
uniref:Zinc finger protein ZAT1 n=1 Tax=Noccaea caerulescens TaxID=107243 RepID=A0A1J3DXU5_NOCCA